MSISYIFTVIEILICAELHCFKNIENKCNSSRSWFISIFTVVPGWIRFLQCLRRYYNTHHFNPHLLNAGKYLVGIVSVLLGTFAKVNGHLSLRIIWIISLVATTSYSYIWDVKMDWGFFKKNSKNKFLRNDLIFPTWSYYYVMISNLFLRLCWLVTVSPNYWGVIKNGNIVAYGSALVEVFRRFQWNFFRMENEHTNNCGEFRAVKEMPLPYHIPSNSDDDDDNTHDTIDERSSNFQSFVKKLSRNNTSNNNEMDSSSNDNTIDITKFQKETNFKNYETHININNDNDLIKLKRSHSQEHIGTNRSCKYYNENDTINTSNIKFWNIKPNQISKNMNINYDVNDPLNSNRTIHTYSVDNEFNQYIDKMKENLSSIDTLIKNYDHRKDSNILSVLVEDFPSGNDISNKNLQNIFDNNLPKSPNHKNKDNDTFKIDIDNQKNNTLKKESLINSPMTLTSIDNTSNVSSSSLANS
ncbi:EXS-domain-containing protein, partial [Anaeromyces robustus]